MSSLSLTATFTPDMTVDDAVKFVNEEVGVYSQLFPEADTALNLLDTVKPALEIVRAARGDGNDEYIELCTSVASTALTLVSGTADRSLHAISGTHPSRMAVEHVRRTMHHCSTTAISIGDLAMSHEFYQETYKPYLDHLHRLAMTWDRFDTGEPKKRSFNLSNAWGCLFWTIIAGIILLMKMY